MAGLLVIGLIMLTFLLINRKKLKFNIEQEDMNNEIEIQRIKKTRKTWYIWIGISSLITVIGIICLFVG